MTIIALLPVEASWVGWIGVLVAIAFLLGLPRLLGIVYIPHTHVGIIEKIWSSKGSLREGQIIARNGEAGLQAKFLRGGIHFGLYPWQYRIHKEPLVIVAEGKMAYVYARDGVPLEPTKRWVKTSIRIISRTRFASWKRKVNGAGSVGFCARVFTPLTWGFSLSSPKNVSSPARCASRPIVTNRGERNWLPCARLIRW